MERKFFVGIIVDFIQIGVYVLYMVGDKYIVVIVDGVQVFVMVLFVFGECQLIVDVFDVVDGLLFIGSYLNVELYLYGGELSVLGMKYDLVCDVMMLLLLCVVIVVGVFVFVVCCGFQELNVVCGGMLYQCVYDVFGFVDYCEDDDVLMDM